jgi:ATP10 protein
MKTKLQPRYVPPFPNPLLPLLLFTAILFTVSACSRSVSTPPNIRNSAFPSVKGTSLNKQSVSIPEDYRGKTTLILVGYTQRAQFDIDRWILGALQADVKATIVEVPTIAGMMPQMVQGFIDGGMRSGIPKSDWGSVVTVYEDAPKIIEALGNERTQSAYAVLLNGEGKIVWSSNIGYSATQILELKKVADSLG